MVRLCVLERRMSCQKQADLWVSSPLLSLVVWRLGVRPCYVERGNVLGFPLHSYDGGRVGKYTYLFEHDHEACMCHF